MLATRLHPVGWHRPDFLVEVDFGPSHSQDFAGARGGQNAEFQRQPEVASRFLSLAMKAATSS
jgi:hypothetical protein